MTSCASGTSDTEYSFFSTARRTNQEAPPLLSGFVARRLAPPSGAAELAALRHSSPLCLGRLASSRPDKGGRGTLHASFRSFRATMRYPGEENTRHGLDNPAGGRGDKKTPPRRSGEAGVVQCARRVPRVECYLLSITRVAFFNPLAVASRVILPGSSVEATMAVIMPENTFMRGSWNDSSEVGSPLAPAR